MGRWYHRAVSRSVSVVIPTLNEENTIARSIQSALRAGATEVIVSDGGSSDATLEKARSAGATAHSCDNLRGKQMNCAANEATGDIVLFLHGDTLLPDGACKAVDQVLQRGFIFGGFRIEFLESHPKLRLVSFMINLRTRVSRCPWGDQAQFMERARFLEEGGYREYPIMEDYEMAVRMKKKGPTIVLPLKVRTSGRRFLNKGVLRTAAINWGLIARYRKGADPGELAREYRG